MGNDVGKPHALETCSGSVPYLIKILMLSTSGTKGPVIDSQTDPWCTRVSSGSVRFLHI